MDGYTPRRICSLLESENISAPRGGAKWHPHTIMSILTNEKYKGDALLQKKFTTDFLTKKQKINEGEVPQYYVTGSHEAIIDPVEFDEVQAEIARRKAMGKGYSGNSIFSCKLVCGDCGGFYGAKVWHSNDAYRRVIWQCNNKFKKACKCTTPTIDENTIKQIFLRAYNQMMKDRETVISDCDGLLEALNEGAIIDERIQTLKDELQIVAGLIESQVKEHARRAESQTEYDKARAA